jgi:ABC-type multidrug transport system fused ATPase/permease subunit
VKLILRTLGDLLPHLPGRARRFLILITTAACVISLLDLAALALLAVSIGAIVQGNPIVLPIIGEIDSDGYVWVIVVISVLILAKSALSVMLQWVLTRRFALYELEIGDRLFDAYIRAPWVDRLRRTTAELVRLADVGIANTISGFLLPVSTLPPLIVTFLSLLLVLFIAQPVTAIITVVYLGLIGLLLYFWIARKAVAAGRVNRDYSMRVASLMTEMVASLKEITLRDKAPAVGRVVHQNRQITTRARANLLFLSAVPRFVIDSALIGGFVLVGLVSFLTGGVAAAAGSVALFGVAGFRMIPSLTGFQSIIAQASSSAPHVQAVLADIAMSREYIAHAESIGKRPLNAEPRRLSLEGVSFTYPGATGPALRDVSLDIPMGSTIALVGSSGAGKSTLVDIILGLLVPSEGRIRLDDQELTDVLAAWRSRVGYVPQEVTLFDGSIAQNVALTWDEDIDRDKVREALRRAQLLDIVEARPGGIDGRVGERGISLSGGQRQRLGIARALYVDPLVLVLDEATSALDTKTEADVAAALAELRGEVTLVSVAHRLSTIRHSDLVCFMRDGTVVERGSFDELVERVPDCAVQAALAGLK